MLGLNEASISHFSPTMPRDRWRREGRKIVGVRVIDDYMLIVFHGHMAIGTCEFTATVTAGTRLAQDPARQNFDSKLF